MAKAKKTRPRKSPARKKKPTSSPPWIWMMGGVAAGLGLAALIYLTSLQPPPAPTAAGKPTTGEAKPSARFDFYSLLPERQFPGSKQAATQARSSETSSPPQTVSKPSTAPATSTNAQTPALIQAGSFRSATEADRLRAELILMGLQVHVESVELGPNDAWHRVRVGPFANQHALDQAQKLLADNKIKHMVVRLK